MKAIDSSTAVDGRFVAGNPQAGQAATNLNPAWCNGVQEEILNVVRSADITPAADEDQLLDALLASLMPAAGYIPVDIHTGFTQSGTTAWTKDGDGINFPTGGGTHWVHVVVPAGLTVDKVRVTHTRATTGSPSIEVGDGGDDVALATNGAGGDVTEEFTLASPINATAAATKVRLAITGAAGLVLKNFEYHYERGGIGSAE